MVTIPIPLKQGILSMGSFLKKLITRSFAVISLNFILLYCSFIEEVRKAHVGGSHGCELVFKVGEKLA
jgi:hypothetical protein